MKARQSIISLWVLFAIVHSVTSCGISDTSTPANVLPQPLTQCCTIESFTQEKCFVKVESKMPECPNDFSPTFTLYTRSNSNTGTRFASTSIPGDEFSNNRKTIIIIHGWAYSFTGELVALKDALLTSQDVNVIALDWSNGATQAKGYPQGVANTQVLGVLLSVYVKALRARPGANQYFHCIGHHMGAQICAFINLIKDMPNDQTFDRISALDPAGPKFEKFGIVNSTTSRDVIHTSYPKGTKEAVGTLDFYPNGGANQPGCNTPIDLTGRSELTVEELVGEIEVASVQGSLDCNVEKAILLFKESVTTTPCFKSTESCTGIRTDPSSFSNGIPQTCVAAAEIAMGYNADPSANSGMRLLTTGSTSPMCNTGSS